MKRISIVLFAALVAGCASKGQHLPQRSKPPLPVPAKKEVPLDPSLADQAKQLILHDLSEGDAVRRANAIEAVQHVLPDHTSELVTALNDAEPVVRFAAAMAVGQLKVAAAHDDLSKLVDDTDSSVRVAAAFALHRLGDFSHSRDLEKASQDNTPMVRGNTALALGLIGDPSAIQVLRPMEHDPNVAVRLQVAEAEWRLGDNEGLKSLVSDSISQFPDVQMLAILALAEPRDHRARPNIRANLSGDYFEVNLIAARAMGMLDSDEGYGVAQKGAKSSDPRQKALAALAFGAIGRSDAQPYLADLLKDGNPNVRLAAAAGILQLKE